MPEAKKPNSSSPKNPAGFLNEALDRAKKVFESTSSRVEETSKKAWKLTEEIAESVSQKAEEAVQKIKDISQTEEPSPSTAPESKTKKPLAFKTPGKNVPVSAHLKTLANDIDTYLAKNGEATLDKIANVMKRRKNTQLMVFCAIGWLLHEDRIVIGADNTTLATKQKS